MRRLILSIAFVSGVAFFGKAQQADTTTVAPDKTEPAVPVKTEMPEASKEAPSATNIPQTPVSPVESTNPPRIIYYQDSKPDYKNKKSDIKTISGSVNHSGGFFGIDFRTSQFESDALVMAGFRTGWIVNRTLGIGVEGHGIIPSTKYDGKYADKEVILLGGYGGMFMEFILFSNQVVHVTFPVSGGAGWLGYHKDWENHGNRVQDSTTHVNGPIIDQDVFWYVEPGASLELNVSRNFRMAFGLTRRFTQDLKLVNTSSKEFENLNFFITLKLGKF